MSDAEYLAWIIHTYTEMCRVTLGETLFVSPFGDLPDQAKDLAITVAEKLLNGHVKIIVKS